MLSIARKRTFCTLAKTTYQVEEIAASQLKYEVGVVDTPYEIVKVFDPMKHFISDQWLYISEDLDLGMGTGIILTSIGIRLIFMPLAMYAQKNGIKYRLIKEDIEDIKSRRDQLKDNPDAAGVENARISLLK